MRITSDRYLCWRCLVRNVHSSELQPRAKRRNHGPQRRAFATVHHSQNARGQLPTSPESTASTQPPNDGEKPKGPEFSIRTRLLQWEAANPAPVRLFPRDYAKINAFLNYKTRGQNPDMVDLDVNSQDDKLLLDGNDLLDPRLNTGTVSAGDLVEVTSKTWRIQLLAICLGHFNGYDHFYTDAGKWFASPGLSTQFTVSNFISPSDLQPVIDAVPMLSADASPEEMNTLQELKLGPSRPVASQMIHEMQAFAAESHYHHQINAARLDNAFATLKRDTTIVHQDKPSYANLDTLARYLLTKKDSEDTDFPPAALYAVHKALIADDASFRMLPQLGRKRANLFEISSLDDLNTVQTVEKMVRQFYNTDGKSKITEQTPLSDFIYRARRAIDYSRKARAWSPHGMLSPSTQKQTLRDQGWSAADIQILNFFHLWTDKQNFALSSHFHWIGAGILRALDRYQDSEHLTMSVGWTFLQEVGWITPWDIHARYLRRLPDVPAKRGKGFLRSGEDSKPGLSPSDRLSDDRLAAIRKDWRGTTAFCVDAASTRLIDDAISLESTEKEDEFLIHVHIADPASRMLPDSPWAKQAEQFAQNLYLPGNFEPMFADEFVRETFSLSPESPCLTFTAKVNLQGEILDHRIAPGYLGHVVYMSADELESASATPPVALSGLQPPFAVGSPTTKEPRNRKMTTAKELSPSQSKDLKILSQLAHAISKVRQAKGALPFYWPRPEVTVSLAPTSVTEFAAGPPNDTSPLFQSNGDPHIRISIPDPDTNALVPECMRLAGEVAARWCHARGVPIPYLTQRNAAHNRAALDAFTGSVLYPHLRAGRPPTEAMLRTLSGLVGGGEVGSTPAPHYLMGVDMYTKATSPLRRYSDLLVHWQIEAALLEERRRGGSLVGNSEDGFLPFTKERLDEEVLPMLSLRERTVRALTVEGNREWMLQALVRAWKFGEAELPGRFRFVVNKVLGKRLVKGVLDWFGCSALLEPEQLDGAGLRIADVRVDDVFEVELADVNVYSREVFVKALRRVEEAPRPVEGTEGLQREASTITA